MMKQLINEYKFNRVKAAGRELAQLLDGVLPALPNDVVIVPIPTVMQHIRQRGYDHALLLCREFARIRKVQCVSYLERITNTVQHGSNRRERRQQARRAFRAAAPVRAKRVLLVDDICTTGYSLEYATKVLRAAGVEEVWVAVIAAQPLDK